MTNKDLTYTHYQYVAKQMALRHLDALKFTKEYIKTGFMKSIDKEINDYLYQNFGLDFSYVDYVDINGEPNEVIKYSMENCIVCKIPIYVEFMNSKIETIPRQVDKIELPTKSLKASINTKELRISSIDEELFKTYDAKYIFYKSKYSVKGNSNDNTRTNEQLEKLHNIIQEKLWTKLI
ncbi:MAG: hypothetical protein K8R39_11850 [Arcobacteraceae bacterium]|nr:hypothetical protein [Arcobacteraceae bacterium]